MAKKVVGKARHETVKLQAGTWNMRGFRHAPGKCGCGGVLVHAKVVQPTGSVKMGIVCAGRDPVTREAMFVDDEEFQGATPPRSGIVQKKTIQVSPELQPCGEIYGRTKPTRFGSA